MWPFKKRPESVAPRVDVIASIEVRDGQGRLISRDEGPREPMSDERYEQILRETVEMREQQAEAARLRMVRGRQMSDVSDEIDQLKREGRLEEALDLAYECLDAAERSNAAMGGAGAGRWYERVAIILRKLGDVEAEIRLLEDARSRYPGRYDELATRITRAKAILGKRAG